MRDPRTGQHVWRPPARLNTLRHPSHLLPAGDEGDDKLPSPMGALPSAAPGDQLRGRLRGVSLLPAERSRRLEKVARSLRSPEYSLQTFHVGVAEFEPLN